MSMYFDPVWVVVIASLGLIGALSLTRAFFPDAWLSLRFDLQARMHARRVMHAGFTPEAIERAERALCRACFTAWQIVPLSSAVHAWTYLRLAGDARVRSAFAWLAILVPILLLVDGYALGYSLAAVAAVDASEDSLKLFSSAAGVIGAGLLGAGMHASGQYARWHFVAREVKREIIFRGGTLPQAEVSFFEPQGIDEVLPLPARRWARIEHRASLWPVWACVLFVLFVGVAVSQLRFDELTQLRVAGATGLPADASFVTGIVVLFVFFVALQMAVFWMSYHNTWLGRESQHAYRAVRNGRLAVEEDVTQHNRAVLEVTESHHSKLHQYLQPLNARHGSGPIGPVIYPSEVLAQMLQERAGMESLPNRNTPS